ncbi:MAG: hypothetical protein IJV97_04245 [Alphaproteobacteria bacterium]|nr:hypothetical protein [Alphaproteobacteria bacterium]
MKKLAILSPLVILMASTSLAQDSCIVRPSCADMGYTKTIDDCTGKTTIKCPFDLTAVSCEDEDSSSESAAECASFGYINTPNDCSGKKLKCPYDENAVLCLGYSLHDLDWNEMINITKQHSNLSSDGTFTLPKDGCILYSGNSYRLAINNKDFYINPNNTSSSTYEQNSPIFLCLNKNETIKTMDVSNKTIYNTTNQSLWFIPYKLTFKSKYACDIGDYYYEDDTCLDMPVQTKTPIGIVFDTEKKLVISLSHYNTSVFTYTDISGITNYTANAENDYNGLTNSKILWANGTTVCTDKDYQYNLTSSKFWYIPSAGEINKLSNNFDLIQSRLTEVGATTLGGTYSYNYNGTPMTANIVYTTSTEYNRTSSWFWRVDDKTLYATSKQSSSGSPEQNFTRCIFSYADDTDYCKEYNLYTKEYSYCNYSSCTLNGYTFYKLTSCDCSSFYTIANKNTCINAGGIPCPTDETLCSVKLACPGYYGCGGVWQYCEGTTCPEDETLCSVECVEDYFPSGCSDEETCENNGGVYRNGYCSVAC